MKLPVKPLYLAVVVVMLSVAAVGGYFFFESSRAVAPLPEMMQLELSQLEEAIDVHGIVSPGNIQENDIVNLRHTYTFEFCKQEIEKVADEFDTVFVSSQQGPESNLILSGQKPITLQGVSTCSTDLVRSLLCGIVAEKPASCGNALELQQQAILPESDIDDICFSCCVVVEERDNALIVSHQCGQECGVEEGYIVGKSKERASFCLTADDCSSDATDIACCLASECVAEGDCYSQGSTFDIDGDQQTEVCTNAGDFSAWAEPDRAEEFCLLSGFDWTGTCCGDDNGEKALSCEGVFCHDTTTVCCESNECNFNGQCYTQGCAALTTETGDNVFAYCDADTNSWVDLDDRHCSECLGSNSAGETVCCGDDPKEGSLIQTFTYQNSSVVTTEEYQACVFEPSSCVFPETNDSFAPGCYSFNSRQSVITGTFECSGGLWTSPELDQQICESCELVWSDIAFVGAGHCCGDQPDEHLISGNDGTVACCPFSNDCVVDGVCGICDSCGNGLLQQGEQCDPPLLSNSPHCTQNSTICFEHLLGTRDPLGTCTDRCLCEPDAFTFQCVKDQCGAECNADGTGCPDNKFCTSGCTCEFTELDFVCGDGICEEGEEDFCSRDCAPPVCPARATIALSQTEFTSDDIVEIRIELIDEGGATVPNSPFVIERLINGAFILPTFGLTTPSGGAIFNERARNFPKGEHSFVLRSTEQNCDPVGATAKARFSTDKPDLPDDTDADTEQNESIDIYSHSLCGNGVINPGESCESGVCRPTAGCNYNDRTYDSIEYCSACACGEDIWSAPDSFQYCDNCNACGDGVINCNEECETGLQNTGQFICRDNALFQQVDSCFACEWTDNGITDDVLIDTCTCDCSNSPNTCVNGNWIEFNAYQAGCNDGSCNACNCQDNYHKDTDEDGIEDKCEVELCTNGIDDNDDGLIDDDDPSCEICASCGEGLFSICQAEECNPIDGCYFRANAGIFGDCETCNAVESCEDYTSADQCLNNACGLDRCIHIKGSCCTDNDGDGLCDRRDNCPNHFNPEQHDVDQDTVGDACDFDDNNDGCADNFTGEDDESLAPGKDVMCGGGCSHCIQGQCVLRVDTSPECEPLETCNGVDHECQLPQ